MITNKRIQLTLFVNEAQSLSIEEIRKKYNPVQYELIKSHVTLCRENEIENIDKTIQILEWLNTTSIEIEIEFGNVVRFAGNKGVLIPAAENNESFYQLRRKILYNKNEEIIYNPEPHITIMHPRNSTCTDEIFEQIKRINFPKKLLFDKISLIEKQNESKWEIIHEVKFNNNN